MEYKHLEEYGAIGDGNTVALVGSDGSIDWCPLPHVESPSVFAALLDADRGGHFAIQPAQSFESVQQYRNRTNILETAFKTASGSATVTDFMPISGVTGSDDLPPAVYRKLDCNNGPFEFEITFKPRFDYARDVPAIESTANGIIATGTDERAFLSSDISLDPVTDGHGVFTTVTLEADETHWLILGYGKEISLKPSRHQATLEETVDYWQAWAPDCDEIDSPIGGQWHDLAVRSLLVLKLLIHRETGAVCAAPTTSLPEDLGGVRNWDYRFNWIRDAAFTVRALSELGHLEEATSYFQLCLDHCQNHDPAALPPVYGLHGGGDFEEFVLDHLEGYRGSSPVRIGNAAREQHQLDVYGELILAIYESIRYGGSITADDWEVMCDLIDYVCEGWDEADASIWEARDDPQQYVYSKVMCWVALDRGIKLAEAAGDHVSAPLERWRTCCEDVREATLEQGFSDSANSFVQSFSDDEALDAANLLIPVVGFLPPDDPRVQGTIDATINRLVTDDGLVQRYEGDDGLPGEASPFIVCSFWLVTALTLAGRTDEAINHLESVLEYTSPLGLLAEAVDPDTGEQLGNFPQAYSHIGLINSVLYLADADGSDSKLAPLGRDESIEQNGLNKGIVRQSNDNKQRGTQ
ncbi:glycoside hydrolase family 15 protein (plasmid) [Natrinema zhouii]|uniref:glycoside hydrolase family 15 protein n=1 Tax=Natrinema zhouii TaxID=1710539 RepID=UPI001D0017D9|nr:glycoside hydrolase family 15 protein [Natrinema zhouii]UHQ99270.1 glycoside hydrolase family 15 protein [Natrinema zhouii]